MEGLYKMMISDGPASPVVACSKGRFKRGGSANITNDKPGSSRFKGNLNWHIPKAFPEVDKICEV